MRTGRKGVAVCENEGTIPQKGRRERDRTTAPAANDDISVKEADEQTGGVSEILIDGGSCYHGEKWGGE